MPVVIVVGAQWGDEGKGKIVDLFTESAHAVVRWAGEQVTPWWWAARSTSRT